MKVYTAAEASNAFLPQAALNALGARSHIRQGSWFVAGETKAQALAGLAEADIPTWRAAHLRIAHGDALDALLAAGWLAESGQVLATAGSGGARDVVQWRSTRWVIIGTLEYNHTDGGQVLVDSTED